MSSNRSLFEFGAHLRGVMSGGELPELTFEQLALELFRLQFTINAPYRSFCESKGASPSTVQRWAEIPAIPAVAFKELDLTSLAKNDRSAVFHSSGTDRPTTKPPLSQFGVVEDLRVLAALVVSEMSGRRGADFLDRSDSGGGAKLVTGSHVPNVAAGGWVRGIGLGRTHRRGGGLECGGGGSVWGFGEGG